MSNQRQRITQASSANVVEFPQPDRWASSAKEHTAKICTLAFKQINRDHELSAHARSVGIDILDHVNCEDGFAEVSQEKTAERLGYSKMTVPKCIDALVARGYFRYEPGKAGRNHCGKYWPVLRSEENPHRVGVSGNGKTPISDPENPQMTKIKPPRRGVEQSYNNLKNKSAASAARSADADRDEDNIELMIERYGSTRAQGALNAPYGDDGFIEFGDTPQPRHPTSSLHASS